MKKWWKKKINQGNWDISYTKAREDDPLLTKAPTCGSNSSVVLAETAQAQCNRPLLKTNQSTELFQIIIFVDVFIFVYTDRSTDTDPNEHFAAVRQELKQMVNTFYRRLSEIVNELRKTHIKERQQLLELRRSSSFQITLTSFRNVRNWCYQEIVIYFLQSSVAWPFEETA